MISINASLQTVFDAFTDLDFVHAHVPHILAFELLEGSAKMQVGTKWQETRKVFGKESSEVMWVTDLVQNERVVFEAESHGTHYTSTYAFTEEGGTTHVKFVFVGEPLTFGAKVGAFVFGFMTKSMEKLLKADLEAMKEAIEA